MATSPGSRQYRLRLPSSPLAQAKGSGSRLPITLYIKGGLLMAFGPEGDPVPASLARDVCAEADVKRLRLRNGISVDCQRALAVLDAQQRGKLSKTPSNRWIEAMLGIAGSFEPTPEALLKREPNDAMPPEPESLPQVR